MSDCSCCNYAEWDYEEYYGTTWKQYFICGCVKGLEELDECESFEEEL